MRAFLTIMAVLGVLAIGLVVAVAAGWDPLASFSHKTPRATTAPAAPAEDEDAGDVPTTGPSQAEPPPEPPYTDRTIVLRAENATVSGRPVKIVDFAGGEFHKGHRPPFAMVTGWKDVTDSAEWTVDVPAAGKYAVAFDYASGGYGKRAQDVPGEKFVLTAGDARITGTLAGTRSTAPSRSSTSARSTCPRAKPASPSAPRKSPPPP